MPAAAIKFDAFEEAKKIAAKKHAAVLDATKKYNQEITQPNNKK